MPHASHGSSGQNTCAKMTAKTKMTSCCALRTRYTYTQDHENRLRKKYGKNQRQIQQHTYIQVLTPCRDTLRNAQESFRRVNCATFSIVFAVSIAQHVFFVFEPGAYVEKRFRRVICACSRSPIFLYATSNRPTFCDVT